MAKRKLQKKAKRYPTQPFNTLSMYEYERRLNLNGEKKSNMGLCGCSIHPIGAYDSKQTTPEIISKPTILNSCEKKEPKETSNLVNKNTQTETSVVSVKTTETETEKSQKGGEKTVSQKNKIFPSDFFHTVSNYQDDSNFIVKENKSEKKYVPTSQKPTSTTDQQPYRGEIRRGDIMWARYAFPTNPTLEKIRPVVVIQKDTSGDSLTVVPITSSIKNTEMATHIVLENFDKDNDMVEIECITTIDRKNVYAYQRSLTWKDLKRVMIGVFEHLGIL